MKIMIVGSMCFAKEMVEMKNRLEALSHKAALPYDIEDHLKDPTLREDPQRDWKHSVEIDVQRKCFEILAENDALLVLNISQRGVDGYIGASVLMEIGLAYYLNKNIFLLNPISPQQRYADDVMILGVKVLNGDIAQIPNTSQI